MKTLTSNELVLLKMDSSVDHWSLVTPYGCFDVYSNAKAVGISVPHVLDAWIKEKQGNKPKDFCDYLKSMSPFRIFCYTSEEWDILEPINGLALN